jgi:hypothetical protein
MSVHRRIPLRNSKSESSKFSAGSANFRKFMLDWVLRAIGELQAAEAEFRPPPQPKIATALVRPGNIPNFGEKGLFQRYSPVTRPESELSRVHTTKTRSRRTEPQPNDPLQSGKSCPI